MSSSSEPISGERFALAIADLPLPNVYNKAAEIRNSIAHLLHSNAQLQPDAEQGDRDCADAISENLQVMERMEERLQLLKHEVERRGYIWTEGEAVAPVVDGIAPTSDNVRAVSGAQAESINGLQATSNTQHSTANSAAERSFESHAVSNTAGDGFEQAEDEDGLHL